MIEPLLLANTSVRNRYGSGDFVMVTDPLWGIHSDKRQGKKVTTRVAFFPCPYEVLDWG